MSAPDLSGIAGNFFTAAQRGYSNSLNGSITNVATTITMNSLSGFTTGDSVFLWIEPSSSNAELVYGIVNTSTNQLTSCVRGIIGSAAGHANGATVSQYVSSADHQAMRKGILVQHNQDGTHKAITAPSVTTTGAVTAGNGLVMSGGSFAPTGSWDNWVFTGESWTYLSATTITVPSDATVKYDVGDWIKLTQSSTIKVFIITGVSSTVLTVAGVWGATLANSTISAPAYSKARNPHGASGLLPYNSVKFNVYRNAAHTPGISQPVKFDTKVFDTGSNVDIVTNQGRFTAPTAGFYQFNSNLLFQATNASQDIGLEFVKNGGIISRGISQVNMFAGTTSVGVSASCFIQLAANDYVEVYSNSGQSLLMTGVPASDNVFSGFLVSAI